MGKRYSRYKAAGKHVPLSLSLSYRFYEGTVIKLLRKTLGLERANFSQPPEPPYRPWWRSLYTPPASTWW